MSVFCWNTAKRNKYLKFEQSKTSEAHKISGDQCQKIVNSPVHMKQWWQMAEAWGKSKKNENTKKYHCSQSLRFKGIVSTKTKSKIEIK